MRQAYHGPGLLAVRIGVRPPRPLTAQERGRLLRINLVEEVAALRKVVSESPGPEEVLRRSAC